MRIKNFRFVIMLFLPLLLGCNLPSANPTKEASLPFQIIYITATFEIAQISKTTETAQNLQTAEENTIAIDIVFTKDSNCRSGPGRIYEEVSYFLKGEINKIVGRNADTENIWFYLPKRTGIGYCWISNTTVVPVEGFLQLPIIDDYKVIPTNQHPPLELTSTPQKNTEQQPSNNNNNVPIGPSPIAPPPVDVTAIPKVP